MRKAFYCGAGAALGIMVRIAHTTGTTGLDALEEELNRFVVSLPSDGKEG